MKLINVILLVILILKFFGLVQVGFLPLVLAYLGNLLLAFLIGAFGVAIKIALEDIESKL